MHRKKIEKYLFLLDDDALKKFRNATKRKSQMKKIQKSFMNKKKEAGWNKVYELPDVE